MPVEKEQIKLGVLVIGGLPTATRKVTIASGEGVLKRGAVIGQVTADKKYKLALAASADGSEDPRLILAHDVDATAADVTDVDAYSMGEFNSNEMTFGTGVTAAAFETACDEADRPIFIKTPV
ncbi:MAG: head decoration protein [Lentilitoribacter sp.]